jgi:hypothetical protein
MYLIDSFLHQVRDASQICYMRATADSPPDQITPTMSRGRPPVFPHPATTLSEEHRYHTGSAQTKPCPTVPSTQLLTATDYANYMKDKYPLLVREAGAYLFIKTETTVYPLTKHGLFFFCRHRAS